MESYGYIKEVLLPFVEAELCGFNFSSTSVDVFLSYFPGLFEEQKLHLGESNYVDTFSVDYLLEISNKELPTLLILLVSKMNLYLDNIPDLKGYFLNYFDSPLPILFIKGRNVGMTFGKENFILFTFWCYGRDNADSNFESLLGVGKYGKFQTLEDSLKFWIDKKEYGKLEYILRGFLNVDNDTFKEVNVILSFLDSYTKTI